MKFKEEWQTNFLLSMEFKQDVDDQSYSYLQTGFQKCRSSFRRPFFFRWTGGLPTSGQATASLPDETGTEDKEQDLKTEESESPDNVV